MRDDAIGMFWQEEPKPKGERIAAVMPEIPDTGWVMPTSFPDLSKCHSISIDTETFDPDLKKFGPGWARGVGHLVGVSIGDDRGNTWYFPMRHEIEPEYNMDPEVVLAWLRGALSDPKQAKIGANIIYDVGWLQEEGVYVKGPLFDVQFAEALLDEAAPVALESLGQKYLGLGKESEDLYLWCSDYYGGPVNGSQRKNIYRTPARLTGFYAESDADLPMQLMSKLWPLMVKEGLIDLFMMENELIPLYVAMRFAGVTVNVAYAEELKDKLQIREDEFQAQLDEMAGCSVNINAGASMAEAFDNLGIPYGMTKPSQSFPEGKPSFTKAFLKTVTHPIAALIQEVKTHNKLRSTFVQGYILDSHINGKVYGQFHPMRGETYGTRSGRYSSSNPNLQNIPSRDPILAPLIRGLFIPDIGHKAWRKYDYSQIEYRFMVHYAVGAPGDRARKMFNDNPDLDYHDFAQQLVFDKIGMWIERKPIKNINFGLIYGMGLATLCEGLGVTRQEGKKLLDAYFAAVDFAKPTMDDAMAEAKRTGIIKTIMGRKSRFDLWEPADFRDKRRPVPLKQALMSYGQIQRASTHKALNRKLQGSAADQMKKAMHYCWVTGIFDRTGVPRLTVHDELDFSDPGGCDEAFAEMKAAMENALPLKIPVKADGEIGPDWGHVFDLDSDEAEQYMA